MHRAIDGVKMHPGLRRGKSGPVLHVQSDRIIAERVDKISSPIILVTRRVQRIKRALELREWHRLHAKQGWRTEFTDGVKEDFGLPFRARVAPNHTAHRFPMQRFAKGGPAGT